MAQGLLDDVAPVGPAGVYVGELVRVGEERGDRLVDDVDGGLVTGADHEEEGVAQFGVRQPSPVALVVAGRDEQARHVVAGLGPLDGDELVEGAVEASVLAAASSAVRVVEKTPSTVLRKPCCRPVGTPMRRPMTAIGSG